MSDPRHTKLAEILVQYSCELKRKATGSSSRPSTFPTSSPPSSSASPARPAPSPS